MDGKSLSSDQNAILAEQQLAHEADQRWSLKQVRPVHDRYQYPSLGHHSARRSRAYLRVRGSIPAGELPVALGCLVVRSRLVTAG